MTSVPPVEHNHATILPRTTNRSDHGNAKQKQQAESRSLIVPDNVATMPLLLLLLAAVAFSQPADPRLISNGTVIPDESYADQPYIVKTDDGAWLCVMTTGPGAEGAGGQHVISLRSTDRGKTWDKAVDVEPNDGPEASYAVLLKADSGRIYVFYNHNTDNIRQVIGDNPPYKDGFVRRVDSLGHFVFKYSDDHGRSWSKLRYDIPQRDFEIDRQNPYQGKLKFFWNVGKAFRFNGAGYVPLHKVGGFGRGFFTRSEGVLLRSPNILTEPDPAKITWETLPEGDKGIRAPAGGGPIAEEQSFAVLSDGAIFCVFRTIDGSSAYTYSRDGARNWEPAKYMPFKHPRAANFVWKTANGKYLYWFHNHGGKDYADRNPVWMSGGIETNGPNGRVIEWGPPEILLYDHDPAVRMSYPDLVEEQGRYYITETQKEIARVHEIDARLLEALWSRTPVRPVDGITIDMYVELPDAKPGQVLRSGPGVVLQTAENNAFSIILSDGRTINRWDSDPGTLLPGKRQHLLVRVDNGPKIITFMIDGKFNDGGAARQFGWGRYSPNLRLSKDFK